MLHKILNAFLDTQIHWLPFSVCLKASDLEPKLADHEDPLWMDQILITKARTGVWHPRPFIRWLLLILLTLHASNPLSPFPCT